MLANVEERAKGPPLFFWYYATFLKFVFIEVPPPQFSLETKRFASIEDFLGFSTLCDSPKTFLERIFRKKFRKFFFSILRGFWLSEMGFCCF